MLFGKIAVSSTSDSADYCEELRSRRSPVFEARSSLIIRWHSPMNSETGASSDVEEISDGEQSPDQVLTESEEYLLEDIVSSTMRVVVFPTEHELKFEPCLLKSMEGSGWVSSEFIDAFASVVNKRNAEYCAGGELVSRKRTYIFSVYFMTLLIKENKRIVEQEEPQYYIYDFGRVKSWLSKSGLKMRSVSVHVSNDYERQPLGSFRSR